MSEAPVRNSAAVLFAIAVSAFLATFNETFLNVALTPIMQDFSISSATVQWVSTAYMLVAAVVVPVTSFLYKSIPTRRLTIIALSFLLIGTLLGALAQNFAMLLVARIIQAFGTGMIVPIGMNLTLLVAPQGKLGTYMGVVSAVTLLGPAFGPIVGGTLLAAANWHVLFLVFAALVALCLIINGVVIDNFAKLTHPRLDVPSVVLVSIGLIGIMYAISTAFSGTVTIALGSFVIGAICVVAFVVRQRRLEEPLLDIRPFSNAGFNVSLIVVFIAFMAVFAMNIILPLFMQGALGFSAMDAALTLLAPCMLCCVFAPVAGRLFDRFGLSLSLPLALAVMAIFMVMLSRLDATSSSMMIVALYAPILIGCSFSVGPAQSFALGRLTPELHPHGVTMCYTAIQVAGCVGSSFYVGVMSSAEASALASGVNEIAANASGFSMACIAAACFAVLGLGFALATSIISKKDKHIAFNVSEEGILDAVMAHDVYYVSTSASAYQALKTMVECKTGGLPLVDDQGKVQGFISDGDIMRALSDEAVDKLDMAYYYALWQRKGTLEESLEALKNIPAMDLATKKVVSVEEGRGIEAVCAVLSDMRIKKVPVTDHGRIVGTVSRSDVLRYLVTA